MPTFTRKTFASYYKNLFGINQSGNTGIDNTSRNVQDGDGKNTSISLSKNHLNVKPENTNSSTTFNVKTLSGASLLTVDTSNNDVLAGGDWSWTGNENIMNNLIINNKLTVGNNNSWSSFNKLFLMDLVCQPHVRSCLICTSSP